MAKLLKLRRGTTTQHGSFTGAEGEVTIDTTKDTAVVHDGSTAGGTPLAKENMDNVSSLSIVGRIQNSHLAGVKVQPNFGSQNVETTGTLASGNHTVTGNISASGNITVTGTVDGVDVAALKTSKDSLSTTNGTILGSVVLADGVTATTQAASDNSTKVATTAYTTTAIANINTDSISEGNSTAEIIDSGTGEFKVALDGTDANLSLSPNTLTLGRPSQHVDIFTYGDIKFSVGSGTSPIIRLDNTGYLEVTGAYNAGSSIGTVWKFGGYNGVHISHGSINPSADSTYSLGADATRWTNVYADNLHGVLHNSVTATTQSAGDNSTKIATTAYTDTAISNLVDSSPSALNTLNELAAALGDDANFSTTVTNSIATKMPLAGGEFSGDVTCENITPDGDSTRNLGTNSTRFANVYADTLHGDGSNLTGISAFVSGMIMLWSGSEGNIPSGWVLCNGSNSTPDLRDRFVVGAGNSYGVGSTGGANHITLTVDQMPSHSHSADFKAGTWNNSYPMRFAASRQAQNYGSASTNNTGGGQSHENRPPFYALCYIMKT